MAETPDRHGAKPQLRAAHLLLTTAIGVSVVCGPTSLAQEPTAQTDPAAAAAEPEQNATVPAGQDLIDPAIADTAPDQESVLEDYEASEQISEDLSVSFPVDI
jgi:hypothetical protein